MSDVFISYARSTAAQADRMTQALRSLGYQVWRDDQLPAHLAYGEVIEERLHEAKAVVVIWSVDALQSVWVRSEADRARALRKLVQISVDGCRLPMPFDQIQCVDLAGWAGETDHKGFTKVAESVAELVADRVAPIRTWSAPAAAAATAAVAAPPAAEPRPEAREFAAPAPAVQPQPVELRSEAPVAAAPVIAAPVVAAQPQPVVLRAEAPVVAAPVVAAPVIAAPVVAELQAEAPVVAAPGPATQPPPPEPRTEAREVAARVVVEPPPAQPPPEVREYVAPVVVAEPLRMEARVQAAPAPASAPPLAEPQSEARAPASAAVAEPPAIAPAPPQVRAAEPLQAVDATPRRAPSRVVPVGLAAAAAIVLVGGVWLAIGRAPQHAAPTPARTAAEPTLALALAPTGVPDQQISQAAAAVVSDARGEGRPAGETASVAQMATRIDAILAQLKSASAQPGGASTIAGLTAQLNQTAAQGAQAEAASLSRAADSMAGEARGTLGGGDASDGAPAAMAALRASTQKLHAANANIGKAADAAGSLAALHASFAAWGQVRADYATAKALFAPVLRAHFRTAESEAAAVAQRVIATSARASKPWLFASGDQKRAYAAAQANGATARSELAQLEALAQSAGSSNSESQLRAAIRQVGAIRSSLEALPSTSSSK